MRKSELIFNILLIPLDFLMLVLAGLSAYFLRMSPFLQQWRPAYSFFEYFSFFRYFFMIAMASFFWLIVFGIIGLYNRKINQPFLDEFLKIIIGCSAGIMTIAVIIFFGHESFDSRFILLSAWFFAIFLTGLARFILRKIWKKYGFIRQKVVLIGDENTRLRIKEEIKNFSDIAGEFSDFSEKIYNFSVDEIIFCKNNYSKEEITDLVGFCEKNQINFRFMPDLFQAFFSNIAVDVIAGFPIVEIKRTPLEGWGTVVKRFIDIIVSLIGIIILFPFGVILGLFIKIDSPGPILVKLKRVNQGKEFFIYKFRSMQNNAENLKQEFLKYNERDDGPLFKVENDPRITRVGRFIRKTWIDEFPQLINVLKGEMSLVGPRPHEPEEVAQYQKNHKRTFFIKPGMTGLAQITGASKLKFEEEVKLDLYYIKNWSLFLDTKIILRTIVNFIKGLLPK